MELFTEILSENMDVFIGKMVWKRRSCLRNCWRAGLFFL